MHTLSIATDFSETLGGRFITEGAFSGEEFRDDYLIPSYLKAQLEHVLLTIDLGEVSVYPTAFLSEAFGGLGFRFYQEDIMGRLRFSPTDIPNLVPTIRFLVEEGQRQGWLHVLANRGVQR